jgi:subtilisin family serine protease
MRRRIVLLVAALAVPACLLSLPAQAGSGPEAYIVVLKDAVDPAAVASLHAARYGARVDAVWGHALHGYAAVIPNDRVAELRADANVKYVVADGEASISAQTLPWGIDRVDADTSATAAIDGVPNTVDANVYVIDTGIDSAHPELNVVEAVSFVKGGKPRSGDCNGHGTHVSGTIAAKDDTNGVVGVAPGAPLHAVRVLNCQGSGQWSWVISGIDWVTANHGSNAVANMSLGGGANQAVDDAVVQSMQSGVFYGLAAGNSGADACGQSPARAGSGVNGIMTVAATDSSNREASWSNYGPCVDIWAPGVDVLSTWTGGGYNTISGTSMASPHVTGGGALYRAGHPSATPLDVETALRGARVATGTTSKDGNPILLENVGGF